MRDCVWVRGCVGAWVLLALVLPGLAGWLEDSDIELHGFGEYRYGERLETQDLEADRSLNELRV